MKRALSLFLCLAMLVACFSVSALAATNSTQVYAGSLLKGTLTCGVTGSITDRNNWELDVAATWSGSAANVSATIETQNYLTGVALIPKVIVSNTNTNWAKATHYPSYQNTSVTIYGCAEVYGSNFSGLVRATEYNFSLKYPF